METIALAAESILTISTQDFASVVVSRLADVPGGSKSPEDEFANITLGPSNTISLGPFSAERRYLLSTVNGVSYSISSYSVQNNRLTSGIYTGGLLYINPDDSTKFNIAAGSGVIIDNYTSVARPLIVGVEWSAKVAVAPEYIADNFTSYVAIDKGGNVVQFSGTLDPVNRRDYIIIGLLIHTNNTVVENVSNFPSLGYDQGNIIVDLADSIGIINRSGNVFSANGTNRKVQKSIGSSFKLGGNFHNSVKSPNVITTGGLSAPDLFKPYQDGVGGFKVDFPLTSDIDPTKWDNGTGTLASVPGNRWTIQRIYYGPTNDDVIVHYGQNLYTSMSNAEAAISTETFNKNPVLEEAILRAFLVIRQNCTNLADTASAKFIAADKFGLVPAQGSNIPLPIGYLEAQSEAKSDDFDAYWNTSYIVDNSASPIVITLPEVDADDVGFSIEFWITSNASTNTVTIFGFDYTYCINGIDGVNPDAPYALINNASVNYLKVSVRSISQEEYLISNTDSVSV